MNFLRSIGMGVWSLGFRLIGLWRSRTARWTSDGGRVLVVAPHPDDELAGCGGAILEHGRRGDPVRVLFVTDGRRSRAGGLSPNEMAQTREQEAMMAAGLLGVNTFDWLGLEEGSWIDQDLTNRLVEALAEYQPSIVYAPSLIDFHPEHRRVAIALSNALLDCGADCMVRVFQVQVPLTSILVNLVLDVGADRAQLRRAIGAYVSQQRTLVTTTRLKHYAALAHCMGGLAEEFWELKGMDYARLHLDEDVGGLGSVRGIRSIALTDPLAYAVGRRLRASMKSRV